ncbi:MAG: ROK family protein [Deltaproteobacteria bacterium]|nr:ROK family protein [Deltaproteobacteria bacterium]
MTMTFVIGIDVGGTHLRAALVDRKGMVSCSRKTLVGSNRGPEEIVSLVGKQISSIEKEAGTMAQAVGVGLPGIVSEAKGIVYASPHYPEWKNVDFQQRLEQKLNRPVVIDNDANMIALGEHWLGSAREWGDFLMMTLGTGIGGAIVINSAVYRGIQGFAGEFGHMVLSPEGPECACGSRGCFETFVSATALNRMVREAVADAEIPGSMDLVSLLEEDPSILSGRLVDEAKKGNEAAGGILKQMGYYLGIGLGSLFNVTGINRVVLGGGLIFSADFWLPTAREELKRRTYAETDSHAELRLSQLGDSAGILGAATNAFSKASSRA